MSKTDQCCDKKPLNSSHVAFGTAVGTHQTTFRVSGMDCSDEVAAIEGVLKGFRGVSGVRANLMASTVSVFHDESVDLSNLRSRIQSAGVRVVGGDDEKVRQSGSISGSRILLVATSGILGGFGLGLQWLDSTFLWLVNGMFCASILAGGILVFPKALRAVKSLRLDMNVLMSVAVVGALVIGEFAEASAVVFLFALAELLESFSVGRARRAIQSLLKLTPETALVRKGQEFKETLVDEVPVGAALLVKSGSRIPLDGLVIGGQSSVNQAPITGEAMPVEKNVGDMVLAGTLNGEGALEIEVTKKSSDSKLSQIIRLVEEAQKEKAPSQRFVDTFAKYYTPIVFAFAILTFIAPVLFFGGEFSVWLYRALVLLVIACPCALVIATPVSIVSGLTAMARQGVLIKGGVYLEAIGKLRALAVDKTGTITEGNPRVTKVVALGRNMDTDIVRIAASVNSNSTHPLARAVLNFAKDKGIPVEATTGYQSVLGRGAYASIGEHSYFLGNHRFAHELGVCSPEIEAKLIEVESQAQTAVVVGHKPHEGCQGEVIGYFGIGDKIREEAKAAIRDLHQAGLESVVMLSGDNQRTVDVIAKEVGIDSAFGDLLPEDKVARIKQLTATHLVVGMVGDGVNDAPAMAVSSIGIAMGAAGTDTAIETADVALMQDNLGRIATAIRLGRKTRGIIRFNIVFALATKAIFLILALLGYTSLWLAIAADTGATLLVIANSLRLLKTEEASSDFSLNHNHLSQKARLSS